MGFGKIWSDITESSLVMNEPIETRYLFIMMLSQADSDGMVNLSAAKMARQFNMPLEKVNDSLDRLLSTDPESRTPEKDGRRIEALDDRRHQWQIVNYERYRNRYSSEHEAQRKRDYRARKAALEAKQAGKAPDEKVEMNQVRVPYRDIVQLWNDTCTDLTQVREITEERKSAMKARWMQQKVDDLSKWKRFFEVVHESDFLSGRSTTKWKATFDWCIKKANCVKIYEGNYRNER